MNIEKLTEVNLTLYNVTQEHQKRWLLVITNEPLTGKAFIHI